MTQAQSVRRPAMFFEAGRLLRMSAAFWFIVAVAGQWLFVLYLLGFYGRTAMAGNLEAWAKVLSSGGIISGDPLGNAALVAHLTLAVIVMAGGPLQLIPKIRNRFPVFHRWNGRTYMVTAIIASAAGLYMEVTRDTVGNVIQKIGTGLDGVLVIAFAVVAWRYAMARNFATHSRWALRLFMVVSAVWFFRIGLMFWLLVNQGPVGFDPRTFEGPFLEFLGFAQYLIPLAVLEIYLWARDHGRAAHKVAMAAGLLVLTVAMGVGIFGAAMGLWLPHL